MNKRKRGTIPIKSLIGPNAGAELAQAAREAAEDQGLISKPSTVLTYQKQQGKYIAGEDAYCGQVKVGSVNYNGMRSRSDGDDNKYVVYFFLTDRITAYGYAPTEELAKQKLEAHFKQWLDKADLTIK